MGGWTPESLSTTMRKTADKRGILAGPLREFLAPHPNHLTEVACDLTELRRETELMDDNERFIHTVGTSIP